MKRSGKIRHTLGRLIFFSFLWWAFTDGSSYQLWMGAVVVLAATATTMVIPKESRFPGLIQGNAVVEFVPYFIFQSLKGGFLVARLALSPRRLIRSQYIDYGVTIQRDAELARIWFASLLCIFPGTLSCGYREDILVIHVLDIDLLDPNSIRKLEGMIAAIFDLRMQDT